MSKISQKLFFCFLGLLIFYPFLGFTRHSAVQPIIALDHSQKLSPRIPSVPSPHLHGYPQGYPFEVTKPKRSLASLMQNTPHTGPITENSTHKSTLFYYLPLLLLIVFFPLGFYGILLQGNKERTETLPKKLLKK